MSTAEFKVRRSRPRPEPSQGLVNQPSLGQGAAPPSIFPLLRKVEQIVMPVWPLQDYVAVNPWAGLAGENFLDARRLLREVSDGELLLPLDHYRGEFQSGQLAGEDIQAALAEVEARTEPGQFAELSTAVWQALKQNRPEQAAEFTTEGGAASRRPAKVRPRLQTVTELADLLSDWSWTDWLQEELTRFCSGYFDFGQAIWMAPGQKDGMWSAWRRQARHDRNPACWGLSEVRNLAGSLPADAPEAIALLLEALQVPELWQERWLKCEVLAMPGWFAWARQRGGWTQTGEDCNREFAGLLAIRLVYEVALARSLNLTIAWAADEQLQGKDSDACAAEDEQAEVRAILLRASELRYRRRLLAALRVNRPEAEVEPPPVRPLAQMVFCIDVRSERIRRNLEALAPDVKTSGFAGFFGMPFEYRRLNAAAGSGGEAQLPVLLQPQFAVQEELIETNQRQQEMALEARQRFRLWSSAWKRFQTSLASCFPGVETTGWAGGWKMMFRSLGGSPDRASADEVAGWPGVNRDRLGPGLRGLNAQGWSTTRQIDLAESLLRNLGLVENFPRLVVLCGHRCEVENNPLRAALDCGACGGHSGEANARFAAILLNQEFVRRGLGERGIMIPADAWFVAAVHQTTSDELEFPDQDSIPFSHAKEFTKLRELCRQAGELVATERGVVQGLGTLETIRQRASDWSQVRPEWGLVGNAAFVAGPRELTRGANLDGRVFLHDYDHRLDDQGKVLELILTAPLIVASWINLQYYASAVDPASYGSGCKTIHNVVGKFGVLAGSGSDLQVGLPWQSVAVGTELRHSPLRLQAVVAAPRQRIDKVIAGHQHLCELLSGGWIHLSALDDQRFWQWEAEGQWRPLEPEFGSQQSKCGN